MGENYTSENSDNLPRDPFDFYPTRIGASIAHVGSVLKHYRIKERLRKPLLRVLDVGIGHGVYGKALFENGVFQNEVHGIEIQTGMLIEHKRYYGNIEFRDFMEWNPTKKYDLVIGNIPYYNLVGFMQHANSLVHEEGVVSFLLKQRALGSAERAKFYTEEYRPHTVFQFDRRPFLGKMKANGKRPSFTEDAVAVNFTNNGRSIGTSFYWLQWTDTGLFKLC